MVEEAQNDFEKITCDTSGSPEVVKGTSVMCIDGVMDASAASAEPVSVALGGAVLTRSAAAADDDDDDDGDDDDVEWAVLRLA